MGTNHSTITTELGDAISHDLPPPYPANEEDNPLDIFYRLVKAAASEMRTVNGENALDARTLRRELKRVKNIITFVLSIDYQCHVNATLSSADRNDFMALCNVLSDIHKWFSDHNRPSLDQHRKAAPYFSRSLHQTCQALNVPTEYMAVLLSRFAKYQNFLGKYRGCCTGLLRDKGLDSLPCKLVIDRDIVIPTVAEGWGRWLLKLMLEAKMAEFLNELTASRANSLEG